MRKRLVALLLALALPAGAQDLTAEQIVEKATDRNSLGFDAGQAQITMVLQSKSGEKRERKLLTRTLAKDSLHKSMMRFLAPADVQGTAFLLIEQAGDAADDMYLYLPALKRTRRIAGSQKNGAFMGSDFSYADMESRDVKSATYEKKADATIDGVDCYHVVATPKAGEDRYSKVELWVRKDNFLPQQSKFFDTKGELLKVFRLHEAKQIDGQWVVTKSQMWNKQEGTSTFLTIDGLDTKTPLDPAEFAPDNLSKG
jgi:outer membrane lipoprotein-sorting protein